MWPAVITVIDRYLYGSQLLDCNTKRLYNHKKHKSKIQVA